MSDHKMRVTEYRGCTVYGPNRASSGWYVQFTVNNGIRRIDVQTSGRDPLYIMRKIRETVARVNEESGDGK